MRLKLNTGVLLSTVFAVVAVQCTRARADGAPSRAPTVVVQAEKKQQPPPRDRQAPAKAEPKQVLKDEFKRSAQPFMDGNGVQLLCADSTGLFYTVNNGIMFRSSPNATPTNIAVAQRVVHLISDAQNIYFALHDDGSIHSVPKTGGPSQRLYEKQGRIGGLALREEYLYFSWSPEPTSPSRTPQGRGTLMRLRKPGGNPELLATGLTGPRQIAVDDVAVYAIGVDVRVEMGFNLDCGGRCPTQVETYMVHRQAIPRGTLKQLSKGNGTLTGVGVDAQRVYWWNQYELTIQSKSDSLIERRRGVVLAADEGNFYALDRRKLMKWPKTGQEPTTLADDQDVVALSVSSESVYWLARTTGGPKVFALAKE